MPPAGEAFDDDYVISLLKRDADATQKRYLSGGLGSLLPKEPRGNAPKPNTRFLKNIIRETDSHNAALKAKEEEESKVKLHDLRKEQLWVKRTRSDGEHEETASSKRRKGHDKPGRWAIALAGLAKDSTVKRSLGPDHHSKDRARHDSHRAQSVHVHARDSHNHRHKRREKKSRRHSRSRSPSGREARQRRSNSKSRSRSPAQAIPRMITPTKGLSDDGSDPLEGMIGPQPAVNVSSRGRGAAKSSAMDSHFESNYNPKEDVDLESNYDGDDWDLALEALRDRTKWRTQGRERLKAAGFTDQEVKKWEKGGERDVDDVRWSKTGESREWDRGKVIDDEGNIDVKAKWSRVSET